MIGFISGIVFIALIWSLLFFRCKASVALSLSAVALLILYYGRLFNPIVCLILAIIWLLLALLVWIRPLRLTVLIKPFLRWFQRENPPLSLAEQQVIDAGGAWWGNELFSGEPNWDHLLKTNLCKLTPAEQSFLEQEVSQFCDLLDEWRISSQGDLPPAAWEMIKNKGFWALEMAPEYGGHGFSPLAHSAIISKIASKSISAAITVMVPNSLGPAEFLKNFGTLEQKNYYLPRLARGEEIACFALTGPEAGSDAASISDSGVVCWGQFGGKNMLGVRLNFNKRYITLAPVATLIGLAFRMFDPEHLLGNEVDIGVTLALVPAHLSGVTKGTRHAPMNMGFMNGPVRGKEVFLPLDQLIGGVERRGQGWQMMMECLVVGRGISLPSLATAMAQFCLRMSSAYAIVRRQFHRPIAKFEGISQVLGRIGGLSYLCEALRLSTVQAIQTGARPAVGSAISKYHLTEFARQIVADSMDIHAGKGIQLGPRDYLGYLHFAVPINITVEGANILTRGLIIYGQGVLRCHPYLRSELTAAMNQDASGFDRVFCQHIGFILSQLARLVIYGLTAGRFIRVGKVKNFQRECKQLTRMSNAFAVLTDITLLVLGKRLKIKEALSARLGDVLSYLCMGVALLQHFINRGQPPEEKIFLQWGLSFCFRKMREAIVEFLANFPIGWVASLLRFFIFPWGSAYKGATDATAASITQALCENLALRKDLSQHCHLSVNSSAWKMEQAFIALVENAGLLTKLIQAKGTLPFPEHLESYLSTQIRQAHQQGQISDQEKEQLQTIADLYWEVIQVDEFEEVKTRHIAL